MSNFARDKIILGDEGDRFRDSLLTASHYREIVAEISSSKTVRNAAGDARITVANGADPINRAERIVIRNGCRNCTNCQVQLWTWTEPNLWCDIKELVVDARRYQ